MVETKRTADILIFNDKNELALQLRAIDDQSFPDHWDFSAGGGIDKDEDPIVGAKREIFEELGVKVDVEFVAHENLIYLKWDGINTRNGDIYLYKARHNGPFNPSSTEVQRIDFFSLEKIEEMIRAGEKFHTEFLMLWEKNIIQQSLIKA